MILALVPFPEPGGPRTAILVPRTPLRFLVGEYEEDNNYFDVSAQDLNTDGKVVDGMDAYYRPFTILGLLLIVSGLLLVLLPFLARHLPSLEKLPWIILWVYRRDGFYFATSPLLIIISLISLLLNFFNRPS